MSAEQRGTSRDGSWRVPEGTPGSGLSAEAASGRLPRMDFLLALLVGACMLLLYLRTRSINPMLDGLGYCHGVLTGNPGLFIMGQHVLYGPLAYAFSRLSSVVAPGLSVWSAMRLLSSICGAATVVILILSCRYLGVRRVTSVLLSLLMGLSIEFWRHSVNVEYIIPNTFFLALFLLAGVHLLDRPVLEKAFLLGCALGVSALSHLSHLLLVFPFLILLTGRRNKLLRLSVGGFGASIVIVAGYLGFGRLHFGSIKPGQLLSWALSEATTGSTPGETPLLHWSARNLLWAPVWQVGAMVRQGHVYQLAFGDPRINSFGSLVVAVLLVLLLAGVGAAWRNALRQRGRQLRTVGALSAWVVAYGVFFSFWCPSEEVWWVSNLLPLCALVAIGVNCLDGKRMRLWLWVTIAAVTTGMTLVNLTDYLGILHQMKVVDPQIRHLVTISSRGRPGDLVLWLGYVNRAEFGPGTSDIAPMIEDQSKGRILSTLFAPVYSICTDDAVKQQLAVWAAIEDRMAYGYSVWVSLAECTLEETLGRVRLLHPRSAARLARLLADYRFLPTDDPCLWRLSRPAEF